jgi:hypothetical protein
MRTVSFSSPAVRKILNEQFICTRIDTTGDPTAGTSFSHAPSDPPGPCARGNGQQNIQLLFLTSEGELFDTLAGFVGPEDLADELKLALSIVKRLRDKPADPRQVVRDLHADYLAKLGYSRAEIEQSGDDPLGGMFTGIGSALSQGNFAPEKMLEGLTRGQALHDHRFAIRHPLLPWKQFRPEMLVGSGKSFFGSTGSGTP